MNLSEERELDDRLNVHETWNLYFQLKDEPQ